VTNVTLAMPTVHYTGNAQRNAAVQLLHCLGSFVTGTQPAQSAQVGPDADIRAVQSRRLR
jgi:hypothetical protein